MPGSEDQLEQRRQGEHTRPRVIAIASLIWIIYGFMVLPCFVWFLTTVIPSAAAEEEPVLPGLVLVAALFPITSAGFLHAGLQTLHGKAHDTLGNSIGSMLLGLYLWVCFLNLKTEGALVQGLYLFYGTPIVLAGILALLGRRQYKAWRAARNANPPATKET